MNYLLHYFSSFGSLYLIKIALTSNHVDLALKIITVSDYLNKLEIEI